jgi:phytoene dehydrogenase-like protein
MLFYMLFACIAPILAAARHVAVIGAGFSGLTGALELKKLGYNVTVFEQLPRVGGRSGHFSAEGFEFDEGPSWYAMPDVIDTIFARYHTRGRSDLFNLTRLDPAYRVFFPNNRRVDVPGTLEGLLQWAGPDAAAGLTLLLNEAREKYQRGVSDWLMRPMVSATELLDAELAWSGTLSPRPYSWFDCITAYCIFFLPPSQASPLICLDHLRHTSRDTSPMMS